MGGGILAIFYFRMTKESKSKPIEITNDELNELLRGSSFRRMGAYDFGFDILTSDHIIIKAETPSKDGKPDLHVFDYGDDAVRLDIMPSKDDREFPPAVAEVERRLRALRNLYAITVVLSDPDRIKKLGDVWFGLKGDADLERAFLSTDEYLRLEAAGTGSLLATVKSIGKSGSEALLTIASLFTPQGRRALNKRIEARAEAEAAMARGEAAKARRAEAQARSAELDALKKEDAFIVERAKTYRKYKAEMIKLDPHEQEKLKELFDHNARVLQLPPPEDR
jgi:hypothetical protein